MGKSERKVSRKQVLRAGAVGAIAGAAIGVAAAAALSNKKTRKKVVDTFNEIKDQAVDAAKKMGEEGKSLKKIAQKKLSKK